jgi:hypothetical protein
VVRCKQRVDLAIGHVAKERTKKNDANHTLPNEGRASAAA